MRMQYKSACTQPHNNTHIPSTQHYVPRRARSVSLLREVGGLGARVLRRPLRNNEAWQGAGAVCGARIDGDRVVFARKARQTVRAEVARVAWRANALLRDFARVAQRAF